MSEVAEQVAAERVIPHVLDDAAAIGVSVGLLQFLRRCRGEPLQQHLLNRRIPNRIDDRFVGEHGIAVEDGRGKREKKDKTRDVPPTAFHRIDRRP